MIANRLRQPAARAYFRSRLARRVVASVRNTGRDGGAPDLAHLALYNELMIGPVQRDEALMLHGLIRVVRPATIVEIGFLRGHSAFNFLRAMDDEARLYSFDIDPRAERRARLLASDPRFTFRLRSQTEIGAADIDGRRADFVFLDASHALELNKQTWRRLIELLDDTAIVAVHDTGSVPRPLFEATDHWAIHIEEGWVNDEFEVIGDERGFVNWILEAHPEFAQVHLHSRRTIRCGITLLQKCQPLPRPALPFTLGQDATTST
jgi:predicted O-methyltransferase YrrM